MPPWTAMSSTRPSRVCGVISVCILRNSDRSAGACSTIGVTVTPGATALHRMPCAPYWQAIWVVSAVNPPLAAEYAPPRNPPTTAKVEVMLMIAEPGPMCGSTSRASRNGARSMIPRKWSKVSSSVSCRGLGLPMPALLIRKSIRDPSAAQRGLDDALRCVVVGQVDGQVAIRLRVAHSAFQLGQPVLVAAGSEHRHPRLGKRGGTAESDAAAGSGDDRDLHSGSTLQPSLGCDVSAPCPRRSSAEHPRPPPARVF